MKSTILKQSSAWLPVLLWAALIFHFSSGRVPVASTVYWQDFAVKKTGHLILFGTLGVLLYRAMRINKVERKKAAIYAVLLALIYGFSDEIHQMFTQGREARARDVVIDVVGSSLAVGIFYFIPFKLSKKLYYLLQQFDLA